MNDIETIREAAKQIRERATNATPGEWYADGDLGVYAYGSEDTLDCPTVFSNGGATRADIEHIAGFGPEVAVAVADWLDDTAAGAAAFNHGKVYDLRALDVARAYLAPTSVKGSTR